LNFKLKTMPQDILTKTASLISLGPRKFPISILGVVLALFLAIVLILLGERFIFDLNRWTNPVIENQRQDNYQLYRLDQKNSIIKTVSAKTIMPEESFGLSAEYSNLAPGISIYYPTKEKGKYLAYKLLIHAAFIIPVFLLVFLLYYLVKIKEQKEGWQIAIYAYMVFAFWMMIHLLGETIKYISYQHKSAAIYIILVLLAVILTPLAVFLQKKHSEKTS